MNKDDGGDKRAVKDEQTFIALCKILSTDVAYRTLISLFESSKSVAEICLQNKTPISSTYKTIKNLQELGLVFMHDIIIDNHGKRIAIYGSKLKSLTLNMDKNGGEIRYDGRTNIQGKKIRNLATKGNNMIQDYPS
jgi:hypothetical protein